MVSKQSADHDPTAQQPPPAKRSFFRPRLNWFLPFAEASAIKKEGTRRASTVVAFWKAAFAARRTRTLNEGTLLQSLNDAERHQAIRASKIYWCFGLVVILAGIGLMWSMFVTTSWLAAINLAIGASGLCLIGVTVACRASRDRHMIGKGTVIEWGEFARHPRYWTPFSNGAQ